MAVKTLSIVIPVYNEEKRIVQTIRQVIAANSLELTKEIIIIDDGSKDGTVKQVKDFLREIKRDTKYIVRLIENKINKGKGAVVKQAFLQTKGDIVLVQDADLEYSPEDYPVLLQPFFHYGADVVFGSRFISDRPHRVLYFWHSVGNKFLTCFSNIFTNLNLTDMETGAKVFKGNLIRSIAPQLLSKRFGFEPEITARISKIAAIKIYEVGISYAGRTYLEGKKIKLIDGIKAIGEILYFNNLR